MRLGLAVISMALLAGCGTGNGDVASANAATTAKAVSGKAAPAGKHWADVVAATPEGGVRMGNPDAPIKLIEFGSRACPYCADFSAHGYPKLVAGPVESGKVSYEFRDYPIHGALDIAPILLGHCVPNEAFFPMLEAMMAGQPQLLVKEREVSAQAQAERDPVKIANLYAGGLGYVDFVKQRGLPETKARACLNDAKAIEQIAARYDAANKAYNVTGTPTFILNGHNIDLQPGEDTWDQLNRALKAAGA